MARDPDALIDLAWGLLDQALSTGVMRLEKLDQPFMLNTDQLVDLVKWLSTTKAKKPRPVSTPEDFLLRPTSSEED